MKRNLAIKGVMATVMLVAGLATAYSSQVTPGCSTATQEKRITHMGMGTMATWAENRSYPTSCAEEDNINVPIFATQPVKRFRVVATNPPYDIREDNCTPDFFGCTSATSAHVATATGAFAIGSCSKLWDDGINAVLVCTEPNWWRYTMDIILNSQIQKGHYLVWHRKIQDEDSWPQFLVLYQDGYLRLKPHPPKGRQDICFGSSVVLGPAAPEKRPYVDVQEIRVYPDELSLEITYRNGETAHVSLAVDRAHAVTDVDVNYTTDEVIPFATFRSMYVTDGNADVDHLQTPAGDFSILSDWTRLEGPWWFFHRTLRSRHNTSAPDIRIEWIE